MKFSEACIRRPVFTAMLNLALIVFGFLGLQRLPVRELPDIDPAIVTVLTVYPGASAEVVETEITELQLRKPASGELRGLSLSALLNIDAGAVITLLPRITTPTLTADEAARLDAADLTACGLEIASFLLPKRLQPAPDGLAAASASPAG